MARIRSIKPEFWTDEKVVTLSPLARLVFIGLWNFVDDYGRASYSPARLKMQILPADPVDFRPLMEEIVGAGLVTIYRVDNHDYLEVCGFTKHQKIDKRAKSKCPDPPEVPPDSPDSRQIPSLEGNGKEGNGREGRGEEKPADAGSSKYAFESGIIKLNARDFQRWKSSFSNLDVPAELVGLTDWASQQSNWFNAVAGALTKRNREVGIAIVRARDSPESLRARGEAW